MAPEQTSYSQVPQERCAVCGACDVGERGGSCPLLTCPKRVLNGPCGSMWDGQCGVLGRACIHVAVRGRLREVVNPEGETVKVLPILPVRDHSTGETV